MLFVLLSMYFIQDLVIAPLAKFFFSIVMYSL